MESMNDYLRERHRESQQDHLRRIINEHPALEYLYNDRERGSFDRLRYPVMGWLNNKAHEEYVQKARGLAQITPYAKTLPTSRLQMLAVGSAYMFTTTAAVIPYRAIVEHRPVESVWQEYKQTIEYHPGSATLMTLLIIVSGMCMGTLHYGRKRFKIIRELHELSTAFYHANKNKSL